MKSKGFTLVEMLAVVVILSMISLIGIFSIDSIVKKGTDNAFKAQMAEIKTAAENSIKVDGEPTWCQNKDICYISIRYLVYNKHIKLDDNGNFINPRTDKPFSLETVIMIKKYGDNYLFQTYESIEKVPDERKAKIDALKSAAFVYKNTEKSCENGCTINTSTLVNKYLEENFYSEVNIVIDENGQITII